MRSISTRRIDLPRGRWLQFAASALAILCLGLALTGARLEASERQFIAYQALEIDRTLNLRLVSADAQALGLEPGDRLLQIGAQPVENLLEYRRILRAQAPGSTVPVQFQRGTQVLTFELIVSTKGVNLEMAARFLLVAAFLANGTVVALFQPRDRAALPFLLTAFALSVYYSLLRQADIVLYGVSLLALALASGSTLHLFCTFPTERWPVRVRRAIVLYLPSLILAGLMMLEYTHAIEAGHGRWYARSLDIWIGRSWGFLSGCAAFGLVVTARTLATTSKRVVRQQLKWVVFGLSFSVVAGLVDLTLTLLRHQTALSNNLLLMGTVPLPVGFAFAILRYQLIEVDLVLRRSLVYAVVTATMVAFYLLAVDLFAASLGGVASASSHMAVTFVAALVTGLLASPFLRQMQTIIDRVFYRQPIDFEGVLAQWSSSLSSHLRFVDLERILVQEIPQGLAIERAWLLAATSDEQRLEPPSAALSEVTVSIPTFAKSPLARVGIAAVLSLSAPASQPEEDACTAQWRQAGVEIVLPLYAAGRLVGAYLLGRKISDEGYQRRELDLLRTLANQAAVAIANARLYEQLRAASQDLEVKVQDRTEEVRQFLALVIHEMNVPISAIQGYSELMLEGKSGPITERQSRYLEQTHRGARRLASLVYDLSDVSQIDSGRLALNIQPVRLDQAVDESVSGLTPLLEEKRLDVQITLSPDGVAVRADRIRLVQILTNLLSNACRYTPAGGHIVISSLRRDGTVETSVGDDGIGIPVEEQARVFHRFFRGSHPQVHDQPGSGLGMWITHSLLELQGGNIWFDSEPGRGTTFTFSLPDAT